jgi:hypothetical protein
MAPMLFESLSVRTEIAIPDFPSEWLPLTNLYDPDLPLFPILYFHALDPLLVENQRPTYKDRVFGFVQYLNVTPAGAVAGVVLNKDLSLPENERYRAEVERLVRERLGVNERITLPDLQEGLGGALAPANGVIQELWHKIVAPAFGNALPFGKCWDGVFGLVRFIASFNSDAGRKGELIQTHYFRSAFGERVATGNTINVDFYLLPTFEELQDETNPLNIFPKFGNLLKAAKSFGKKYCEDVQIEGHTFSGFKMVKADVGSKLKTELIIALMSKETEPARTALFENFNAFNRGPHRSIISLMMLYDLHRKGWSPEALSPSVCAKMYTHLKGTYQTPKVMQLYAQQCFGAKSALPIDNWVRTFIEWPLGFHLSNEASHSELFASSNTLGKLERLIWVAAQGRKVHSSSCAEILWCIRYGGPEKEMRGANPLACKICLPQIRSVCPAFAAVAAMPVRFNRRSAVGFTIFTSAKNNSAPNQLFLQVEGEGIYDEYSPRDRPGGFLVYPQSHPANPLTVGDFIETY